MENLVKDLELLLDGCWLDEPDDVKRVMAMKECNMGYTFPIWVFQYGDLWMLKNVLSTYYDMLRKGAELEPLKPAILALLASTSSFAGGTRATDLKSALDRVSEFVKNSDSAEDVTVVINKLQCYTNILHYSFDIAMPWDEMCKAHEKLIVDYVPVTRK